MADQKLAKLMEQMIQDRREREQEITGVEQLVFPKQCQEVVLRKGHEIPLAGHLETEKTRQRRFYWPTLFRDVKQFCKSCINCQKSGNCNIPKAPLIPLPVILEPFTRMAIDIVGPLPRSSVGHNV